MIAGCSHNKPINRSVLHGAVCRFAPFYRTVPGRPVIVNVMALNAVTAEYLRSTSIVEIRSAHGMDEVLNSIYSKALDHAFTHGLDGLSRIEHVVVACFYAWGAFGQGGVFSLILGFHSIDETADRYTEIGRTDLANCLRGGRKILFPSGQTGDGDEDHCIVYDWEENMGVDPTRLFQYYYENSSDVPERINEFIQLNWGEAIESDDRRLQP